MVEYGLGRLHAPDERDRKYLLPPRKAEAAKVRRRVWRSGPVLDQGNTPQCVGYSSYGWLLASPVRNKAYCGACSPTDVYRGAQQNDKWTGEGYEGSSVRGAMKYLQAQGVVKSYGWAFDAEHAVSWVLTEGPVVLGTSWFDAMFEPDKSGYIVPQGSNVGGHAYLMIGADLDRLNPTGSRGAARILNSWGKSWGESGRAWIALADLDKLIKDEGEAATATELLKA